MAEPSTAASFRDRMHDMLRSSILEAAWERASATSWTNVRIADIADDVGVSRQTVYNEFGTKEQLSMVLFERELARFLDRVEDLVSNAERLESAVRAVLTWMLEEADEHRLLSRMVADSRAGSTDGLVPALTTRADLIIKPVRGRLVQIFRARWPEIGAQEATVGSDLLVRFVIGQIVSPTDLDRTMMIEAMVGMAVGLQGPVTAAG